METAVTFPHVDTVIIYRRCLQPLNSPCTASNATPQEPLPLAQEQFLGIDGSEIVAEHR